MIETPPDEKASEQEQAQRSWRPGPGRVAVPAAPVLAVLLVSLIANAILSSRVRRADEQVDRLTGALEQQQRQLDELRGDLRGLGRGDALSGIAAAVERLRGLTFKRTVRPEILSPADFQNRVLALIKRDSPRSEVEASQHVLEAFGVWPEGTDLYDKLLAVQKEQVQGFYDTDDRRLVVPAEDVRNPNAYVRAVLSHEYTHALADQRFNLRRIDALRDARSDDEAAAFVALTEGDAEQVRTLYQRHVLTDEERLQFATEAGRQSIDEFQTLAPFMQQVFLFPYTAGADFVTELYRRGGFEQVDRAYKNPPVSTEQILHPNRYIVKRDEPRKVALPHAGDELGNGWRRIDAGGFGELDTRLVADYGGGQGLGAAEARRLGEGWDGGRYAAYRRGGRTVAAALTVWDSTAEAREAASLWGRWLPLRFGNTGEPMAIRTGLGRGWVSPKGSGMVLRNGDRVLLLLGPDEPTVRRARSAFPGY